MATYTGQCQFCGTQKIIEAKSLGLANERVSRECKCTEGFNWRFEHERNEKKVIVLSNVEKSINEIRQRLLDSYNIEMSDECANDILHSSAKIYEGDYESMTLSRGNIKAKITAGNKCDIVIDVKVTLNAKMEI